MEPDQTVARAPLAASGLDGRRLPAGTRIEEFEILGIVGEGGFGIVYLAQDHSLERRVALKEYMPWMLACRMGGTPTITIRSEGEAGAFSVGLKSFINEARMLARFDHPALVKVYRFWEGNGTAYMAMPFYPGPTLKRSLAERADRPDEPELRRMLDPILDALTVLHDANCYHRDIAPDNILLTPSGPLLLDFGAARRVLTDASQELTAILKQGYAPIEQYGTSEAMRQGPWTDIYALCGVVHYAITGKAPTPAVDRLMADPMGSLTQLAAGRYNPSFLRAIDAGLAVKPESRPQTIAAFRDSLASRATSIERHDETTVTGGEARAGRSHLEASIPLQPVVRKHSNILRSIAMALIASVATVLLAGLGFYLYRIVNPSPIEEKRRTVAHLLQTATQIVTSNGGDPKRALADTEKDYAEGVRALAQEDIHRADVQFNLAIADVRANLALFVYRASTRYMRVASQKRDEGDFQGANAARRRWKELDRVSTQFNDQPSLQQFKQQESENTSPPPRR